MSPDRRASLGVWLLLVGTCVSWRQKVYFDGAIDQVVLIKGLIEVAALLFVGYRAAQAGPRRPVPGRFLLLLTGLVTAAALGALAAGHPTADLIQGGRVLMLGLTVHLLAATMRRVDLLWGLFAAMILIVAVAIITGLPRFDGRLAGGLPPLGPNEIALLCGASALALFWRVLIGRGRYYDLPLVGLLLIGVWGSGSRTGLAALLIAFIVMAAQARAMPRGAVVALTGMAFGAAWVLLTTNMVGAFLTRSDANLGTLNSRTIAWSAALDLPADGWAWWWGGGLALKRIPVPGQYWATQGLDSSWLSAWVQGGLIGVALLTALAVGTLIAAIGTRAPWRMLLSALAGLLLLRSITESGLIDASSSFLLLAAVASATDVHVRSAIFHVNQMEGEAR